MAEYEGVDALLAAITDAELPEGARDDVVFMAEHRSAAADVDVLREQLVIIGDALADSGRSAGPVPASQKPGKSGRSGKYRRAEGPRASGGGRPGGAPKKRFRPSRAAVVGTLAAAAVATLVVGMGWLAATGGSDVTSSNSAASDDKVQDSGDSGSLSAPGYIACSRLIVEGTVTKVAAVPGTAQDRITLDVFHYYKPARGEKEVTFLMDQAVDPRLHRGDEVLIGIQRHTSTPDIWTTGEQQIARDRSWIVKALPESRGMRCATDER
ncbi:hypothetical protein OG410_15515 [Streptomyces sp. NBC_00659]|uniref:hypothetical protein n=1 Tax=Streptomyces sp. NBC_00659 TaxID=2903669 RepID=UPI002E323F12|nr:hypothetical protein [Streptomyces sp. NBC_00659]